MTLTAQMHEVLKNAELFRGFTLDGIWRLTAIGRSRALAAGDYLFLLGDPAECIYVVANGAMELCLPMTVAGAVRDVRVESAGAGKALGWSALVRPYRFTLSARAAEAAVVIGFPRADLQVLFDAAPDLGKCFLGNLSELVGVRLLTFQTLWVRELQHAVLNEANQRR
ncbi:MAG: cyclic nucleotide-binding domain-containing protein [Acidobacteria bacterium]|nr:cyclic nucleotide-binding domain-containing protein [Acidobacteriota bacterium]